MDAPLPIFSEAPSIDMTALEPAQDLVPFLTSTTKSVRRLHLLRMAEAGIVAGQDQILMALASHRLWTVTDLANHLAVRPSTISKAIDLMARNGSVKRVHAGPDARRTGVRITQEGSDKLTLIQSAYEMPETDLAELAADDDVAPALEQLAAVLSKRLSRYR